MKINYTDQKLYNKAKKRVKDIKGFYSHLVIYCIVIPVLITVNLVYEPHFHWFWFSTIGWGTGLLIHWLTIFGLKLLGIGKDWEENKIQELMQKNS